MGRCLHAVVEMEKTRDDERNLTTIRITFDNNYIVISTVRDYISSREWVFLFISGGKKSTDNLNAFRSRFACAHGHGRQPRGTQRYSGRP